MYVSLTKGCHSKQAECYLVIYLLDQDYSFAIAHNIFSRMSNRRELPKAILFAVGYDNQANNPEYYDLSRPSYYKINRTRYYTPVLAFDSENRLVSGGAEKFRIFLGSKLLKLIKKKYRVNDSRTLIGHLCGGLFAA